jgi:hypothetical protein
MFKRSIFFGAIALASATAFAGQSNNDAEFHTFTIQGGQGAPITLTVPVEAQRIEAPYALTGTEPGTRELQWVTMQFGQGAPILIAK